MCVGQIFGRGKSVHIVRRGGVKEEVNRERREEGRSIAYFD